VDLPPTFPVARLLSGLDRVGPGGMMAVLHDTLRVAVGATGVRLLLADVEERVLNVWGEVGDPALPPVGQVQIEGSPHGRMYRTGRPERQRVGFTDAVLVPVTSRAERLGVLEAHFDHLPGADVEPLLVAVGLVVGYTVIAAERWTDEFHVARRRRDMSLAAEVQWNLLPLAALSTDRISIACALEPAYDIGGDGFDYAYARSQLTVGIFDAMGRGLTAARLASLAINAFRNARRRGDSLERQARFIHESIAPVFGIEGYTTGQLAVVDVEEPRESIIVNAGHPAPVLQRADEPLRRLDLGSDLPFGMPFPNALSSHPLPLLPGDRLVLFSDGITDARPDGGDAFGEERFLRELVALRSEPPRETARRIIGSVRAHRAADLADDATMIIIDIPRN
jgi:Stage II sporulation protein E (SpoIIE)